MDCPDTFSQMMNKYNLRPLSIILLFSLAWMMIIGSVSIMLPAISDYPHTSISYQAYNATLQSVINADDSLRADYQQAMMPHDSLVLQNTINDDLARRADA